MPLYAENLGATGIWLGVIFGGFSITRAIFMPIFGRLSNRSGRKQFICTGLLFYSLISLGYSGLADADDQLTSAHIVVHNSR